jgi:hypothetical protein
MLQTDDKTFEHFNNYVILTADSTRFLLILKSVANLELL